ncbi:MBL fold metallo-hydrolase [bacterium]|nr:MBL fold metallo-hydrolase [bacterium]MCI0603172.1 MBL fold metallo-hydrolase [bacterium]
MKKRAGAGFQESPDSFWRAARIRDTLQVDRLLIMRSLRFAQPILLVTMIFFALFASRNELADLEESNQQAINLLEKSLNAYGTEDNLKLSLTVKSNFVSEGQSLNAIAPFEHYPLRIDLKMDQKSHRLSARTNTSIAGDFVFTDHVFLQNGKGYSVNPHLKSYREVNGEPWVVQFLFPHRTVLQALQNRASLRLINPSTVSFSTSSGQVTTHSIDPKTYLIRKSWQLLPMGVYGDGIRELEFVSYRKAGTLLVPEKLIMTSRNQVHGLIQNIYSFENITTDFDFEPEDFDLSSGFSTADYSYRKTFGVQNLAKDVYLLENVNGSTYQWSYNVLVVTFDEFVLVAEAPVSSEVSESVLQKIRELAPGKPVRYLIQSHHHSDHLGGIRTYIAEGCTILTGSGSVPLIEKITAAPFRLNPDRLYKNAVKPVIEPVNGKRVIQDSHHQIVIYDIGPTPHSTQMLIVYLPDEKILYQSDMINEGEYPENETTRHFYKKIEQLSLQPTTIAGLHGKTINKP